MATARQIRKSYDTELAALDLNLTSGTLLMFVVEKGSHTQTALASLLDVGRAAAGLIVDRLVERGLVVRCQDDDDRRSWLVTATPKGVDLAAQVAVVDRDIRDRLRSGVTREARHELTSVLRQMQRNLVTE